MKFHDFFFFVKHFQRTEPRKKCDKDQNIEGHFVSIKPEYQTKKYIKDRFAPHKN